MVTETMIKIIMNMKRIKKKSNLYIVFGWQAAHIALIEAMMGLYAKEILGRDRIAQTLRSFGRSIDPGE